ncbi:MAG TPA: hypothetical protein VGU71_22330 [Candidatus Dormibacteraeota bacterium]|nr:hypothetical protein [Candidatus Dormibacteraeota bacterium]
MATAKVVTGQLLGPDGQGRAGTVFINLSQSCTIPGTSEVLNATINVRVPADGNYSVSLYANQDLTPGGTYYTVKGVTLDGGVEILTPVIVPQSAGPFIMSNLVGAIPPLTPGPGHVSTLIVDGAATFTAGPVVIGADPGGAQILRVGGTAHFSGALTLDAGLALTGDATIAGNVLITAGSRRFDTIAAGILNIGTGAASAITLGATAVPITIPGLVSLTNAGWNSITGNLTISGYLGFSGGLGQIQGAAGGLSFNNNANSTVNIGWNDLGNVTIRGALTLLSSTGINYGTLGGTVDENPGANQIRFYTSTGGKSMWLNAPAGIQLNTAVTAYAGITVNAGGLNVNAGNMGISTGPISNAALFVAQAISAAGGFGHEVYVSATMSAIANNDSLRGMSFANMTVVKGAFTGLTYTVLSIDSSSGNGQTGTGTIANAYGIAVNAPSIGTTNYAILAIGAVAVTGNLTVTGNVAVAGGNVIAGQNQTLYLTTDAANPIVMRINSVVVGTWATGGGLQLPMGDLSVGDAASHYGLLTRQSGANADLIIRNQGTGAVRIRPNDNAANDHSFGVNALGFYGHAAVAQPAAPATLADVIAIIRGCGLSA